MQYTFLLAVAYGMIIVQWVAVWWLTTELKAMQKSTHKVQYVNIGTQEFQALTKEMQDKLQSDERYDNLN